MPTHKMSIDAHPPVGLAIPPGRRLPDQFHSDLPRTEPAPPNGHPLPKKFHAITTIPMLGIRLVDPEHTTHFLKQRFMTHLETLRTRSKSASPDAPTATTRRDSGAPSRA